MFDSKDIANEFLTFLNSRHDSIKFTIEFEEDNKIPFLSILLNNTFSTAVYRKKTFTASTLSGIHSHLASTKSTSSALSPIDASEFAPCQS